MSYHLLIFDLEGALPFVSVTNSDFNSSSCPSPNETAIRVMLMRESKLSLPVAHVLTSIIYLFERVKRF